VLRRDVIIAVVAAFAFVYQCIYNKTILVVYQAKGAVGVSANRQVIRLLVVALKLYV
jgi:hypothetical protein